MKAKIQNLFLMPALLALSTLNLQLSTVFAQTTAFIYQGRLNVNGSPATGIYDLRFTIYDAVTNGNLVAGPLTNSATGVTNGLFAVTLDFGSGAFTGLDRWLQMGVRTNGNGAFTNLSPCQPITPVPYALHAQTSSGTNGSLTGNGITLGSGGTSWDIGVANNALTFTYGDPVTNLTLSPDGSLSVPNNITAGGNVAADGGLQIGGTYWNVNVGGGSGPGGYSATNGLMFSANGVLCMFVVDVPGNGPVVWAPNQLGAMEVDTGALNVRNGSWNSVAHIDSSGNIEANGYIDANGNIHASGNINANGDICGKTMCGNSDRNLKEKFTPVDAVQVLERVTRLPISTWNFKTDPAIRHVGPMAQDFYAAFNIGPDDKHIATVDEGGVALAAIQGLNHKLNEKDAEIQAQARQIEKLVQRLEALEQRLSK
ncbi:MAG: tail fiber domain-containing protein [Verrucomicrobiota bacterium]